MPMDSDNRGSTVGGTGRRVVARRSTISSPLSNKLPSSDERLSTFECVETPGASLSKYRN